VTPEPATAPWDDDPDGASILLATGRPQHDLLVIAEPFFLTELREAWGRPVSSVRLSFLPGVSAPELDGQEDALQSYEHDGFGVLIARGRTNLFEGQPVRSTTAFARTAAARVRAAPLVTRATSVGGIGLQQNGAAVLSKSAEHYFGNAGKILLAVIVFLACLSTAVGLITSCSGYFNRLLPRCAYRTWAILFTLVSCGLANVGLNTIIKLSVPALMLLYPLTIALIALALLHNFFGGGRIVYICTMLATSPTHESSFQNLSNKPL